MTEIVSARQAQGFLSRSIHMSSLLKVFRLIPFWNLSEVEVYEIKNTC